jgi:alkylation response protein AidB-like acyl-CoA dehydrogenase
MSRPTDDAGKVATWDTPEFQNLLAEIHNRREDFERQRYVSQDIVERFRRVGVYRALVAKRFGGDERSPADFCRMIEAISIADGSAGWVASFGASATYLAALPIATLETIYADGPDAIFAGGLFPPQPAERVAGGLKINGRWKFASGCMGATLVGAGITVPDDSRDAKLPRMAVLRRDQVTIEPNWNVHGLVGTGSHDLVIANAVVPDNWTFIRGGAPSLDTPLYRYPSLGLAAQVLAVVGLGIARAALNAVASHARGLGSITGAPRLADRGYVQFELARAEAILRSARAYFYEVTEAVWATLLTGSVPSLDQLNLIRLSATHAAHQAAEATRIAYTLSGTAGIYLDHPLSRYLRDALVVPQHAFLNQGTYENAGRVMLTRESQPGYP